MTTDEKQAFANEAEKALSHPLVIEVIDELAFNLTNGSHRDGLVRYGIKKVAMYKAKSGSKLKAASRKVKGAAGAVPLP